MAANQDPSTIGAPMARLVEFTTTNLDNGSVFLEPHTVSGPTGSFSIPLNATNIGGGKVVVPLTSNTSPGAPYLKFHLPQPGSSEFYVTFAQKNFSYSDGYYDYQTGIPTVYRQDFVNWIADNPLALPLNPTTFNKNLVFTVYGLDTNQVSAAIQYTVRFKTVIGGGTGSVNINQNV